MANLHTPDIEQRLLDINSELADTRHLMNIGVLNSKTASARIKELKTLYYTTKHSAETLEPDFTEPDYTTEDYEL